MFRSAGLGTMARRGRVLMAVLVLGLSGAAVLRAVDEPAGAAPESSGSAGPDAPAETPSRTFLPPPAPLPIDPSRGSASTFPPTTGSFDPSTLPTGLPPLPSGAPPLPPGLIVPPPGLPPIPGSSVPPGLLPPPLPSGPFAPVGLPPAPTLFPVSFDVTSISISPKERMAILVYLQQTYVVTIGTMVPDSAQPVFDVRAIEKDRVTVFDRRINRIVIKHYLH